MKKLLLTSMIAVGSIGVQADYNYLNSYTYGNNTSTYGTIGSSSVNIYSNSYGNTTSTYGNVGSSNINGQSSTYGNSTSSWWTID